MLGALGFVGAVLHLSKNTENEEERQVIFTGASRDFLDRFCGPGKVFPYIDGVDFGYGLVKATGYEENTRHASMNLAKLRAWVDSKAREYGFDSWEDLVGNHL